MEHIKFLMDEKRRLQDNMDGIYNIINDLENDIENYQLEAEEVDTTIKYLDRLIKDEKEKNNHDLFDAYNVFKVNIGPKVQYGIHSGPCKDLGKTDSLEKSIRLISGIDDIEFDTLTEAEDFREKVYAHILKEGRLSICGFKTLLGVRIKNIIETRYGWTKVEYIFITSYSQPLILRSKQTFKIVMPILEKLG